MPDYIDLQTNDEVYTLAIESINHYTNIYHMANEMIVDLQRKSHDKKEYLVTAQSYSLVLANITRDLPVKYSRISYESIDIDNDVIALEEETTGFFAFVRRMWEKVCEFFKALWKRITSIFTTQKKEDNTNKLKEAAKVVINIEKDEEKKEDFMANFKDMYVVTPRLILDNFDQDTISFNEYIELMETHAKAVEEVYEFSRYLTKKINGKMYKKEKIDSLVKKLVEVNDIIETVITKRKKGEDTSEYIKRLAEAKHNVSIPRLFHELMKSMTNEIMDALNDKEYSIELSQNEYPEHVKEEIQKITGKYNQLTVYKINKSSNDNLCIYCIVNLSDELLKTMKFLPSEKLSSLKVEQEKRIELVIEGDYDTFSSEFKKFANEYGLLSIKIDDVRDELSEMMSSLNKNAEEFKSQKYLDNLVKELMDKLTYMSNSWPEDEYISDNKSTVIGQYIGQTRIARSRAPDNPYVDMTDIIGSGGNISNDGVAVNDIFNEITASTTQYTTDYLDDNNRIGSDPNDKELNGYKHIYITRLYKMINDNIRLFNQFNINLMVGLSTLPNAHTKVNEVIFNLQNQELFKIVEKIKSIDKIIEDRKKATSV
jgi:ribosomal protein L17